MKNNNYPDWLVSLDIAIKLKEIGFNEYCPFFVYPKNDDNEYDDEVFISGTVTVEEEWLDEDNYGEVIIDLSVTECGKFNKFNFQTIPTWEQVFEWFREKEFDSYIGLESHALFEEGNYYYFEILKPKLYGIKQLAFQGEFDNYEEAREALVKALIKTYKQEQLK
jgi:hypothetical protein